MPLPDFIPYTDEELKEKQLGPYASGASAPSIAGANAPVQTPVAQTPEDLSQLELVPYTGDELVTAVEGDITKQLTLGEFEKYRRAKSLEPEKTWNQRMSEFGEGAQMAGEEFFGGIWSAASQGFYITDPEKGIKTLASAFARGGVDMFTIFEDIFSKDFYAADTYEDFLEDMDWTDDEYSRKIYVSELSKDKVRFNLKRAFMAEREKWRKGESKTILPFVGEIEGEDVKGAEGFGYLTDFTVAVPGLSAFTRIPSAAAKGVGKVGNLGGKVVGGIGRTGTQISDKVAEQVGKVIPDASTTTTRVATIAGAGVTGQPLIGAALLVPEASKALDLSGRLGQKISQELGKRPSQFGVLERVAMNSSVDPQIRKLARILNAGGIGDKLLSGSGSLALGVGTGMVVGGVLGGLAQGDDGFWQGAGGGFAVGGPASLGGVGLSKLTGHARRSAEDADIMRFLESQAEKGVDPKQAMAKLGRDALLKTATLAKVFQGDVRVNLLDNAGYAKAHRAGAAAWNKDTKTIDINMDAADAKHNVLHEFGHAIFDSPVVNKNEIVAEINRIYGESVVDGMATNYVEKLAENRFRNQHFKNNPTSKLAGDALAAWKQGKTFKNAKGQTVKAADYELSVKMERQDQIAQHGMDWIVSEIFAEDFVGATVDRNINSLRKGKSHPSFFHLAGHILRTKANVFSRMGGKINEHGIVDGKYASRIFGEMTGDKKFKKTLRNYIRDRGRHFDELARRTRKKDGAGPKEDITRMGDHAGFWRDRGDGTFENDFAVKNAKGEVTIKDAEQIAQDLHNRAESVRKLRDALVARGVIGREDKRGLGARLNEKGDVEVSGQILPDDVIDSLDLPQQMKDQLKVLNNLVKNTGTAMVWYNGISTTKNGSMRDVIKTTKDGTPDLRGTTRMWRRNLRKFMGNIKSTRREIKPIGYTITKEGNITVELVDIDAIHDKVHRWQKDTDKNGRPKLELWGNDVGKFYDDLKVYMQNHRDGLGGAEGIGEAKRNAFRAFLMRDMTGSGGISPMHDILNNRSVDRTSMVKSFRLDRIGSVDGTMRDDFHFDYYKVKENLMPDGTPKVKEHGQTIEFNEAMGERFMPVAPEGARYMDLRDMQGEKMVALSIDRLGHGVRTLASGAASELAAQGGRAFMWLEGKWASYSDSPFKSLFKHLRDVGTEYVALSVLGELNHNNTRYGMRLFGESLLDAVRRKEITKNHANAYIEGITNTTSNIAKMQKNKRVAEREVLRKIRSVQQFIDAVDAGELTHLTGEVLTGQRKQVGAALNVSRKEAEAFGFGPTATARMAVDGGLWDEKKFPIGTVVAVMKVSPDTPIIHEPNLHYHYGHTIKVEPIAYFNEFYPLSSVSRGRSRKAPTIDKKTGKKKKRGNVFLKSGKVSPQPLQAIVPELDLVTAGKMGPPIDHPVNYMPDVPQGAYSRSAGDMLPSKGIDSIGRHIPNWKSARVYHSTDKEGLNSIRKEGYKVVGDGYYGDAVSVTPDLNYSKQFGGFITTAKVKDSANILNLNDPKDSDKWMEITKGVSGPDYRKVAMRNGIDGIYDPGAGDLFVYNPSKLEYLGEGMVGGADKGYTSLTLNTDSQNALTKALDIPEGWDVKAHHMTINMGSPELGPGVNLLGQTAGLQATMVAKNDKVMAVKVDSSVPSSNKTPHVTVAVNTKAGGKPVMSNNFKDSDYKPLYPPIDLEGRVTHEGIQGADPHPVNMMPETHWSNRHPKMVEARKQGVMGEAWAKLVDKFKPVMLSPKPTKDNLVPDRPAKKSQKGDDMQLSLQMLRGKKPQLIGAARELPEGTLVGGRIDIPFYNDTKVLYEQGKLDQVGYAIAVHQEGTKGGVGRIIGYDSIMRLRNVRFHIAKHEGTKNDIAQIVVGKKEGGVDKYPLATVEGEYMRTHHKGKLRDDAIPHDIYNTDKWIQVGMDPMRHEYFYRKDNHRVPIESASEAILVGDTAFVRVDDALVQGDRSQHRYMPAQTAKLESDYIDAVGRQDVDTMQSLVHQAAALAGFDPTPMYHGTPAGKFNRFSKDEGEISVNFDNPQKILGHFFTPDEDYANKYRGLAGRTDKYYLKRGNYEKKSIDDINEIEDGWFDIESDLEAEKQYLINRGIMGIDFAYPVKDASSNALQDVPLERTVFDPRNIKSADPVTFDDNGNVIPLHDRFNLDSDDIRYIPAYHGTPHTFAAEEGAPLGKFSTDKIGSGEGAQAYGYGLYFAEKKSVAEWYRDKLTDNRSLATETTIDIRAKSKKGEKIANQVLSLVRSFVIGRARGFKRTSADRVKKFIDSEAIPQIKSQAEWDVGLWTSNIEIHGAKDFNKDKLAEAKAALSVLNSLEGNDFSIEVDQPSLGQMYEVDLAPKEEHFLDLDRSFNFQSQYVKDALTSPNQLEHVQEFTSDSENRGLWSGLQLVRRLESYLEPHEVSAYLASKGIAGNRFQDAPSRAVGSGLGARPKDFKATYNYVVFQDSAVEIKNRYMPRVSEDGKVITIPTKGRIVQTGPTKFRAYNMNGKLLGVAGSQGAADALLNRQKK